MERLDVSPFCRRLARMLPALPASMFVVLCALAQPVVLEGTALESTSVYAQPSREAPVTGQLAAGAVVQVLGYRLDRARSEWWHIETSADGSSGFVPAAAMQALRAAPTAPSQAPGSSLFAQMVGADTSPSGREAPAGSGQSLFGQMARSGDIDRGQEATRQRALEEELRRQEQALLERQRQEQQAMAAEEERLRREEESLRWNDGWDDGWDEGDDWYDAPASPSLAAGIAERIQQGFQELSELQRSTQQETLRNLEAMRDAQARQAQERQQQWDRQAQQQREREQRQRQIEQDRQRLAEERQRRERALAEQRAALEARRVAAAQPTTPVPGLAAGSPGTATNRPLTGNPGRSAPDCIRIGHEPAWRDDAYNVVFSNACDAPVFVIWCARSPYSLNCGENVANFYASSVNLRPGQRYSALVQARVTWGACEGMIGFGHVDFYRDHANGDYTCLPTGDHARAQASPQRVSPRSQDAR
jgi:hypothetical protein